MTNDKIVKIESVQLAAELDRRVALATVRLDDLLVSGISVWRSANGRLGVYWPRYWNGAGQAEAISLPAELRSEIEAEVILAYKEAKSNTTTNQNQKGGK